MVTFKKYRYQWLFPWLLILILSGCSLWQPTIKLKSVQLEVTERANDNSPIAVDFVAVRDPELLKTLQSLTAGQWFSNKPQILLDLIQKNLWLIRKPLPGCQTLECFKKLRITHSDKIHCYGRIVVGPLRYF